MDEYNILSKFKPRDAKTILTEIPVENRTLQYLMDNMERNGSLTPGMREQINRAQRNGKTVEQLLTEIEFQAQSNGVQAFFDYNQNNGHLTIALVADKFASKAIDKNGNINLKDPHVVSNTIGLENKNYQIDRYNMKGVATRAFHYADDGSYDQELYTESEEFLSHLLKQFRADEKKRENSIVSLIKSEQKQAQQVANRKLHSAARKIQSHTSITNPYQHHKQDAITARQGMGTRQSLMTKSSEATYMELVNSIMSNKEIKKWILKKSTGQNDFKNLKTSASMRGAYNRVQNETEKLIETVMQTAYSGLSEQEILNNIETDSTFNDILANSYLKNILIKTIKNAVQTTGANTIASGRRTLAGTQETSFQNQRVQFRPLGSRRMLSGLLTAGGYRGDVQQENFNPSSADAARQRQQLIKKKMAHKAIVTPLERQNGITSNDPNEVQFYNSYISASAIQEANMIEREMAKLQAEKNTKNWKNKTDEEKEKAINKILQKQNHQGAWEGGVFYRASAERLFDSTITSSKKFNADKVKIDIEKYREKHQDVDLSDESARDEIVKQILCSKLHIPYDPKDKNLKIGIDHNGNYLLEYKTVDAMHSGSKLMFSTSGQRTTGYRVADDNFNRQILISRYGLHQEDFYNRDTNGKIIGVKSNEDVIKNYNATHQNNQININDINKIMTLAQYEPKLKPRLASGKIEEILSSVLYADDLVDSSTGQNRSQEDVIKYINNKLGFKAFDFNNGQIKLLRDIDVDPFSDYDSKTNSWIVKAEEEIKKYILQYSKGLSPKERKEFNMLQDFEKVNKIRQIKRSELTQNLLTGIAELTNATYLDKSTNQEKSSILKGSLTRDTNNNQWVFDESKMLSLSGINKANDIDYDPRVKWNFRYRESKANTARLASAITGIDMSALRKYEEQTYNPSKDQQQELANRKARYDVTMKNTFSVSNTEKFQNDLANTNKEDYAAVIVGGPNSNIDLQGAITHFATEDYDKGHIKKEAWENSVFYKITQKREEIARKNHCSIEDVPVYIDPGMAILMSNPYEKSGEEHTVLAARYIAIDNFDAINAKDVEGEYDENFKAAGAIGNLIDTINNHNAHDLGNRTEDDELAIQSAVKNVLGAQRYDVVNKKSYFVKHANEVRVPGSTRGRTAAANIGAILDDNTSYAERMIYTSAMRQNKNDFWRIKHQTLNKDKNSDTYIADYQNYNRTLINDLINLWGGKTELRQVLKNFDSKINIDELLSVKKDDDPKKLARQRSILENIYGQSITINSKLFTKRLQLNGKDKRLRGAAGEGVRDPEFSGTGVIDSDIFIDESLDKNQIGIGVGMASSYNADYDSDRVALTLMANPKLLGKKIIGEKGSERIADIYKAKEAAIETRAQINYAVGKKIAKEKGLDPNGQVTLTDEQINELTDQALQAQVDIVARYNKLSTGSLANNGQVVIEAINALNSEFITQGNTTNPTGKKALVQDMITRGLFETFTQEALSSKKVVDRMKGTKKGSGIAGTDEEAKKVIHDVENITAKLSDPKTWADPSTLKPVLQEAVEMGIISDDEGIVSRAAYNVIGYASKLFQGDEEGFADAFGVNKEQANKMMFKFDANGNIIETGETTNLSLDTVIRGAFGSQSRLQFANGQYQNIGDLIKQKAKFLPGYEDATNNTEYRLMINNQELAIKATQEQADAFKKLNKEMREAIINEINYTNEVQNTISAQDDNIAITDKKIKTLWDAANEYDKKVKNIQSDYSFVMSSPEGEAFRKMNRFTATDIVNMIKPNSFINYDGALDEDIENAYKEFGTDNFKSVEEIMFSSGLGEDFKKQEIGWRATRLGTLGHELLQSVLGILVDENGQQVSNEDIVEKARKTLYGLYGQDKGEKELNYLIARSAAMSQAFNSTGSRALGGEVQLTNVFDKNNYMMGIADIIAQGETTKLFKDADGNLQESADKYKTLDIFDIKNWSKLDNDKRMGLFVQLSLYKDSLLKLQKELSENPNSEDYSTFENFKKSTLGQRFDNLASTTKNGKRIGGLETLSEEMFNLLKDPNTIIRMMGIEADDSGKAVHIDMEKWVAKNMETTSPMMKGVLSVIQNRLSAGEAFSEEDVKFINQAVAGGTVESGGIRGSFSYAQESSNNNDEKQLKEAQEYINILEKIRKLKKEINKLDLEADKGNESAKKWNELNHEKLIQLQKEAKLKKETLSQDIIKKTEEEQQLIEARERYEEEKGLSQRENYYKGLLRQRGSLRAQLLTNQNNAAITRNQLQKGILQEQELAIQNNIADIQRQMDESGLTKEQKDKIEQEMSAELELKRANANARSRGETTFWGQLSGQMSNLFDRFLKWGAVSRILQTVRRDIQKVIQSAQQLDKSLTNLRIVTGSNRAEAKQLVDTYADLAIQLGGTVTEVTESATAWMRQGYEASEVTDLITSSLYLSKLGMIDMNTATQALTSSLKGFKLEATESMDVVDKLTALDVNAATTAGEIATGLSQFANLANLNGVNIDQASAMVATIADVTQQSGGSVGASLKTIMSRYGNVKAGAFANMETGYEGDEATQNLNDVEKVLGKIGIAVRDSNLQFRDFDDVLADVAEKWSSLDNVSQNAVASAFAGRQALCPNL